jgi:TRAP-type mannitol/chloroaromatic compound transport system permease small subunit
MFFASLGLSLVKGYHVRATLIFDMLPRKIQNVFWVMISFVGLSYCSFLTYSIVRLSFDSFVLGARTNTSGILTFPWQMAGALGVIIFLMAIVVFTIERVAIALGIREESEEEREREFIDLGF